VIADMIEDINSAEWTGEEFPAGTIRVECHYEAGSNPASAIWAVDP